MGGLYYREAEVYLGLVLETIAVLYFPSPTNVGIEGYHVADREDGPYFLSLRARSWNVFPGSARSLTRRA